MVIHCLEVKINLLYYRIMCILMIKIKALQNKKSFFISNQTVANVAFKAGKIFFHT